MCRSPPGLVHTLVADGKLAAQNRVPQGTCAPPPSLASQNEGNRALRRATPEGSEDAVARCPRLKAPELYYYTRGRISFMFGRNGVRARCAARADVQKHPQAT